MIADLEQLASGASTVLLLLAHVDLDTDDTLHISHLPPRSITAPTTLQGNSSRSSQRRAADRNAHFRAPRRSKKCRYLAG
ncbi:MAG: hypothetical protein ACJAR2_002337 [Ilumatobacter sp.]|jgi:hypothetical protein